MQGTRLSFSGRVFSNNSSEGRIDWQIQVKDGSLRTTRERVLEKNHSLLQCLLLAQQNGIRALEQGAMLSTVTLKLCCNTSAIDNNQTTKPYRAKLQDLAMQNLQPTNRFAQWNLQLLFYSIFNTREIFPNRCNVV